MKVGITINDDLLVRLDKFADDNYMSRSGLISLAVTQYLNYAEASHAVRDLALTMRRIADNNCIDEVSRKQLEDFERFSQMFISSP